MPFAGYHKEVANKTSFFYVDWHDWSNIIGLGISIVLFVFGFIYIFKALGLF